MRFRIFLLGLSGMVACGAAGAFALTLRPEIAPIVRPAAGTFDRPTVERGSRLAAIGDCAVCHTAAGGAPFAGGRPLATPFGTLYTTNITPDEKTGIGNWSKEAFRRAMRKGVARDGSHLYPALPYEHYTHVEDGDLDAVYAFLMTRRPVAATPPANQLIRPLGFRPLLAGWKMLFLDDEPFAPDPAQSAEWNRGAYLVTGLGHCGGCHTPRNLAGAEESARPFAGGVSDGWIAPPLDASNPFAAAWTVDRLTGYLQTGADAVHGVAAGPMGPVSHGLSAVPVSDVRAMAVYIASVMKTDGGGAPVESMSAVDRADDAAHAHPEGAALFEGACAGCHGAGAPMLAEGRPSLSLTTDLQAADPTNTVQAILQGIAAVAGEERPVMPPFANAFGDKAIADLTAYLRARFTTRPPWVDLEDTVAKLRKESDQP